MRRRPSRHQLLLAVLAVPALVALACGSSNGDSLFAPTGGTSSGGSLAAGAAPASAGGAGVSRGGAAGQGGSGGGGNPNDAGSAGRAQGGIAGQSAAGGAAGNGGGTALGGAAGGPRGGSGGGGGNAAGGGGGAAACVPSSEVCDGLDNDCDAQVDERGCTSQCSGFTIAGRGYMYCGSRLRATLAEQNYCAMQGMHLAWIETAEENTALAAALAEIAGAAPNGGSEPGVYIGGTDLASEGQWRWGQAGSAFWEGGADGESVGGSFANWSAERPNNDGSLGGEDCAVLLLEDGVDGDAGEWNDVQCSNPHQFVCEH